MAKNKPKTQSEIAQDKYDSLMNTIAWRAAYYRANPQRFAYDYLGLTLRLFQKIILYMMFHSNYILYTAARGQSKTFLTAIFCCLYCILFPGSKIVIASSVRSQGNEVLLKIQDELMPKSDNLRFEIKSCNITANKAEVYFKNTSRIKVVTASDGARGNRATVLCVDEFVKVDENIITTVLEKFLTAEREPGFFRKAEYKDYPKERNKQLFLSSAWLKDHWGFRKLQSYAASFVDGRSFFCCGLPYQLSIKEKLLNREQVEDDMQNADFNELTWSMEMECLWFGTGEDGFYKYEEVIRQRKIEHAFYPTDYLNKKTEVPKLEVGERRILSVDIALMASRKHNNDASAIVVNSLIPTSHHTYINNIAYVQTDEGLTTDELGLIVMRLYHQFRCTDLVMDCGGVGLGVYDYIIKDQYDPKYGITYPAMTCVNDANMEERCKVKNALKTVWSIKASSALNKEIYLLLRSYIQQGKLNLLMNERDVEEHFKKNIRGYDKLSITEQTNYKMPYIQTTMLVNELVSLDIKVVKNTFQINERSGMRKDRVSSLAYSCWVASQLERKLTPKNYDKSILDILNVRQPKRSSAF